MFYFFNFVFLLLPVKTPAKSVRWAGRSAASRGPRIWARRFRRHTVQTNSHGNSGCGIPFSVSPRGPSPPPGSRPAPSWHRNGSYPSNWREKTETISTAGFRPEWEEPDSEPRLVADKKPANEKPSGLYGVNGVKTKLQSFPSETHQRRWISRAAVFLKCHKCKRNIINITIIKHFIH